MFEPIDGFFLPSDAKVMNCCQCSVLLLCVKQSDEVRQQLATIPQGLPGQPLVIGNRPYCFRCARDARRKDFPTSP